MRDLDTIQAYEAKQQRLVEGIVRSLYEATLEHKDYRKVFGKLTIHLLETINGKRTHSTTDQLVHKLGSQVFDPIEKFLNKEVGEVFDRSEEEDRLYFAERKYLHLKVFEKVFGSVSSGIIGAYQAEEIEKDYRPA